MSTIRFLDLTRMARTAVALAAFTVAALPQAQAVGVSGQGTWETTLQGRDLDGNAATIEAYYDTALNITWLADGNFAQTSGFDSDGVMSWAVAKAWVDNLAVGAYNNWRLPTTLDTGTTGCNFANSGTDCGYNVNPATSELAHLYFVTLGNKSIVNAAGNSQAGYGLINTGSFINARPDGYWSGVEYTPGANAGWYFGTDNGYQGGGHSSYGLRAWAVHTGDIGFAPAVPEPEGYAIALTGLAALFLARKRRQG